MIGVLYIFKLYVYICIYIYTYNTHVLFSICIRTVQLDESIVLKSTIEFNSTILLNSMGGDGTAFGVAPSNLIEFDCRIGLN